MQSVAIIGGGASGIFCAVLLSLHNIPIVLFEKNKTLGKKLLATGNGRCNIHNIHTNSTHFQSTSFLPKDLQHILQNYPFNAFVKTCQTLGLHFHTQENGKVYPLSNSAKSVLEVFTQALNTNPNLQIHLNTEITTITKSDSNFLLHSHNHTESFAKSVLEVFTQALNTNPNLQIHLNTEITTITKSDSNFLLHSHNHTESFSTLILACGSQAAPKLGGSNKCEILAKQLNLKYHQAYPALVPLNLDSTFLSSLSGVKIQAKLTLKENEQILAQTLDDVLFTNYGISGFGVLDLSSFFQTRQNLTLMLDFLPNLTPKTLENSLQNTLKNNPKIPLETLLNGFLHPKIAKAFATHFNFLPNLTPKTLENSLQNTLKNNPKIPLETLLNGFLHPKIAKAFATHFNFNPSNTKQLKQFLFTLKNFPCKNPKLKDFESAEVCGGGVSGKEINPNTMESKKHKNLYIIGEMLDIVGNRGGYNLAFAWASCGGGVSGKEINPNTMESKKHKNLYIIGEMLDIVGNRGGYNLAFAWASAKTCTNAVLSKYCL